MKIEEEESTSTYSHKQPVQSSEPKTIPPNNEIATSPNTVMKEETKECKESPIARANAGVITSDMTNLFLRKKICQKLSKLLQRSYSLDKEKSQELTIQVEDKMNKFYKNNVNEYKQAIKGLHHLIKVLIKFLSTFNTFLEPKYFD